LSAVTLASRDLDRAVEFYEGLGFQLMHYNRDVRFATFRAGAQYLNITGEQPGVAVHWWGRAIFYVSDVDAMHARALECGLTPQFSPRDAPWGERYFHLTDPDGHEISFAKPL
jgi:catechol 2,3-dioxygenase-like lactoylglutathione lyase family enzyme